MDLNFIFNYLNKLNYSIDKEDFIFQLNSHPEFPSLLSISDTFDFFNIQHLAFSFDKNQVHELPEYFIGITKHPTRNYVFVQFKNGQFNYLNNGKYYSLKIDEFYNSFENKILMLESDQLPSNSYKFFNNPPLWIYLLICVAVIFLGIGVTQFILLTLGFVGYILAKEALYIKHQISASGNFNVCSSFKNDGCETIINTKLPGILKSFSFVDFANIFFIYQIFAIAAITIRSDFDTLYFVILLPLIVSVPIIFLSIYYQKFILKKWCPLCLLIICVLVSELIVFLFHDKPQDLKLVECLFWLLISLIVSIVYLRSLVKSLGTLKAMRINLIDSIKFKRNYDVFKYIYSSLPHINESYKNVSWLNIQESTSKMEILVIISVHCKYCKDFIKILVELSNKYPNQFNVKLGFHCDINHEKKINLYYQMLHLYHSHKDRLKILELYEKNKWNLTNHFSDNDIYSYQQILNDQYQWNKMNNINYTPTIILNSKVIPSKYDFDDIKYFLQEAINDPDFIK